MTRYYCVCRYQMVPRGDYDFSYSYPLFRFGKMTTVAAAHESLD